MNASEKPRQPGTAMISSEALIGIGITIAELGLLCLMLALAEHLRSVPKIALVWLVLGSGQADPHQRDCRRPHRRIRLVQATAPLTFRPSLDSPRLHELREVWEQIGRRVDDHRGEKIFRSCPDNPEKYPTHRQHHDRISNRICR